MRNSSLLLLKPVSAAEFIDLIHSFQRHLELIMCLLFFLANPLVNLVNMSFETGAFTVF